MQVFTAEDHMMRRCGENEIGQPWEERWSIYDVIDGLIDPNLAGKPKCQPTPAPVAPVQPMTRAERKVKLQSVVDKIIHYADAHPEAMLDDNGAQINKLMDLFSKMDEREEEKAPSLDKLSAVDLQKMKLSDLMMLLTTVVMEHVPEDRQAAALQMLRR